MPWATPPWICPSRISGIDHTAAIVDHQILLDVDLHRLGIDLHDHGVNTAGGGASFGAEIVGRLQPRFGAGLDGAPRRIGLGSQFAKRNGEPRHVLHAHLAVRELEFIFGRLKCSDASCRIFLRTSCAASLMALPATTAPRLAKVPAPQ